ncbi:hypothetical protein ElyMa_003449700 [Elysia marginata]|uniref:Uncharacterized protein n=1 Tax=Elysia marginata TaxID=1093978 RepID=A0AAV4JTZ7_9GAST|nr:hypothetical protein ElyMa_003449700 [Elysia marginata]
MWRGVNLEQAKTSQDNPAISSTSNQPVADGGDTSSNGGTQTSGLSESPILASSDGNNGDATGVKLERDGHADAPLAKKPDSASVASSSSSHEPAMSTLVSGLADLNVSPEKPTPSSNSAVKGELSYSPAQDTTEKAPVSGGSFLGGARPKVKRASPWGAPVKSSFCSTMGTQDPDPVPLTIFAEKGRRGRPKTGSASKEKKGETERNG